MGIQEAADHATNELNRDLDSWLSGEADSPPPPPPGWWTGRAGGFIIGYVGGCVMFGAVYALCHWLFS